MKGSRYEIIKLIESNNFIEKINSITKSANAVITQYDNWMPKSIHLDKEAELKDFLKYNFDPLLYDKIVKWWLQVDTTTPNWDMISTCSINGKRGILLVEAKAHYDELNDESHGKQLMVKASQNSKDNHVKIGVAITNANNDIIKKHIGVSISRDKCYQLSNRVAYAWWLANQGIPVVLLYLGFLNCQDMNYGGRKLFENDKDWQKNFVEHAAQVGVDKIIDKWVDCGKGEFLTICRSL